MPHVLDVVLKGTADDVRLQASGCCRMDFPRGLLF